MRLDSPWRRTVGTRHRSYSLRANRLAPTYDEPEDLQYAPVDRRRRLVEQGAEILPVAADADGRVDFRAALGVLADRGITRLMIEGGPTISAAALGAKKGG